MRNRLIVNREREGFAHSLSLLHGPSACAIALGVDSVDKALERASASSGAVLGLKPQPQVEIADPHGAFFSRLLHSPNGELRIAFNVSEGGNRRLTLSCRLRRRRFPADRACE